MATGSTVEQNLKPSTQSNLTRAPTPASQAALRPPVDIFETDERIVLRADMPGVTRERLELRVDGNALHIEGRIEIAPQQQAALYADVRAATYRRQFVLSNELDSASIEANLQQGVLTVSIPKRAEVRPRRIEVQS